MVAERSRSRTVPKAGRPRLPANSLLAVIRVTGIHRLSYFWRVYNFLFFGIIAVFVAMLFLNIYFRVKVFKVYKYLVQNRVEFGVKHFLSDEKMDAEVISRYPRHEEQIRTFVHLIRRSVTMASILIVLILMIGYILMKFR